MMPNDCSLWEPKRRFLTRTDTRFVCSFLIWIGIQLTVEVKERVKERVQRLFRRTVGRDSVKLVIEHYMVLRRDLSSAEVEDQRDKRGVLHWETNKHTQPGTCLPLGDALSILESRVQNIHWAAKDMWATKVRMVRTNPSPELVRGETAKAGCWKTIVNPNSIIDGEWPQIQIASIRPMEREVDQICTSKMADGLDGTFSNTILVMSTDTTEGDALTL
jgi:hypothetical protein